MKPFEKITKHIPSSCKYYGLKFPCDTKEVTVVCCTPLTQEELCSYIENRLEVPNGFKYEIFEGSSRYEIAKGFGRKIHCDAEIETVNLTELAKIIVCINELLNKPERKSIYEILRDTPKHDKVTLRFNRLDLSGHIDEIKVGEEEVRWIQVNIARGNIQNDQVWLIDPTGQKHGFDKLGRLITPLEGTNVLSFDDDLCTEMFTALIK